MTVQVFKLIRVRFVLTSSNVHRTMWNVTKKKYQKIIEEDEDKEIKGVRFLPRTYD
jgi:predicted oxidoreductase (fatty acid repression mutant protein)